MLTCSMARASKIRSSNPSNRPQSRVTPGPAASCRMRCWVIGAPRGVMAMTGRAGAAVAAVAVATAEGGTSISILDIFGFEDMKARRSTRAQIAHDAKVGATPKRVHSEFRCDSDDEVAGYELGQVLTVEALSHLVYVDVEGVSKGKGFQGVMKRYHFRGLEASHGVQRAHRSPGSIGGGGINLGTGPKVKKGKKIKKKGPKR